MTGNAWKFSDLLDDEDIEFMRREFVTYKAAGEYYGIGEKPLVRISRKCGAVYKIGKKVLIRRSIFEEYMRDHFCKDNFFLEKEFFDIKSAKQYYGVGEKYLMRMAREAGAVYKINYQNLIIKRDLLESYMKKCSLRKDGEEIWEE